MKDYLKTKVLVVGAGISGLSFSICAKKLNPDLEICVIDKSRNAGNHILSGAIIEKETLNNFINEYIGNIEDYPALKDALELTVKNEKLLFLQKISNFSFDIAKILSILKKFYSPFGLTLHSNDYIVSLSSLVVALEEIAKNMGIEIYHSFSAESVIFDKEKGIVTGVKLKDHGFDKDGNKQINFKEGETILADYIVLAEGTDGLLTEDLVKKANLKRKMPSLFSTSVKEIIQVSQEQYDAFGKNTVIHTLGYPLTNFLNYDMFGGGIIYPLKDNKLAVGILIGLDWPFKDFSALDALQRFKEHKAIKKYIEGGKVVEAGAKMIPEGGYFSIPRGENKEIGIGNTIILGDSASFVDMRKIRGIHNAIKSGIAGAKALNESKVNEEFAIIYTKNLNKIDVLKELYFSRNFRQTIARYGCLIGMPVSIFSHILGNLVKIKEDYKHTKNKSYPLKLQKEYDKDFFVAMSKTEHRETQQSHLKIIDEKICKECEKKYNCPCLNFCPAKVYEKDFNNELKPLNPSNCLHCKTCQRKCPFANIVWNIPEGGGGPRYKIS